VSPLADRPLSTWTTSGTIAAMALYADESLGAVRCTMPAAGIVHELIDGAERLLRVW
jgi:hypothetical protein